jgi:hypothetical protein
MDGQRWMSFEATCTPTRYRRSDPLDELAPWTPVVAVEPSANTFDNALGPEPRASTSSVLVHPICLLQGLKVGERLVRDRDHFVGVAVVM